MSVSLLWESPHPLQTLPRGEVHVWRFGLDLRGERLSELEGSLSPDERDKADRFRRAADRQHYVAARGLLRAVLARYLGKKPAELQFTYSARGKPALAGSTVQGPGLQFNLSHSRGLALLAVAWEPRVGVDVEWVRPEFASNQTAERFFAPGEVAALRSLPPEARTLAFFRCWTRKEAYLKGCGEGLYVALDSFEVSVRPDQPAALLSALDDVEAPSRWELRELDLGAGYAGAVAVEGRGWELRCWDGNGTV